MQASDVKKGGYMAHRFFIGLCIGALAFAVANPVSGQTKKAWTMPRTPDGHPDLQGVWTNATLTPLERGVMRAIAGEQIALPETGLTVTDQEARAIEKQIQEGTSFDRKDGGAAADVSRAYNNLFVDRGTELARVDGRKRTSLIIDPPEGRVPPLTPEARQKAAAQPLNNFDSVQNRPLGERCIVGFGSAGGPPMLPVGYNSNYQIVQTPGYVMILVEMVHDVRTIRMNATHAPASVRQWLGDSIGHWDGDTLVVDTTNFTDKTRFRGSSENLHVVERFKRLDANTILYRATIDDPTAFTKPWTIEYPAVASANPTYEYACHEGNYAMTDILAGARKADADGKK